MSQATSSPVRSVGVLSPSILSLQSPWLIRPFLLWFLKRITGSPPATEHSRSSLRRNSQSEREDAVFFSLQHAGDIHVAEGRRRQPQKVAWTLLLHKIIFASIDLRLHPAGIFSHRTAIGAPANSQNRQRGNTLCRSHHLLVVWLLFCFDNS